MIAKDNDRGQAFPSVSSGQALRSQAEEIVGRKEVLSSPAGDFQGASPVGDFQGSPEETRQTLHELRVHQMELEMQNEEPRRRAHVELGAARVRYFDLYELTQ
jgi:hypothetical protein